MASPASPIADLTYRNYDGPLAAPGFRWWPIAKMSIRLSVKKKGFWVWSVLSGWWYFILAAVFYFADSLTAGLPGGTGGFFRTLQWKNQFLDAFGHSQLLLLILALLIGVGSIANDNRANALLVYLSKPCTKWDYLIGKWMGIFLPITAVVSLPMIVFYGYCALSYRSYGFFAQDPWLFPKLLALGPISGALHASLSLGISSLFNQGRLAGAVYAGAYFLGSFFTLAIGIARAVSLGRGNAPPFVNTVFYFSIDGLQLGLAKDILGTAGQSTLAGFSPGRRPPPLPPPPPPEVAFFAFYIFICAAFILLAYSRIRAVEVVGR